MNKHIKAWLITTVIIFTVFMPLRFIPEAHKVEYLAAVVGIMSYFLATSIQKST